jgi:putative salt-induced outer membrane protein YdiY
MKLTRALYTCLLIAHIGLADQITLKNGDRLTGGIQKDDGKNLIIKTELAGVVTIPREAVTSISAQQELYVGLADGQTLVGAVTTTADNAKFDIATKETGVISVARGSVQSMRSKEEQTAYQNEIDRYRNPRLVDLWAGALDIGFATSQGNAKTSNLVLNSTASRATRRDKIAVYYTSLFASSNASGKNITTANTKRGGIAYNLNLDPKWFVFGGADLEADQFQSLDLRFAPSGGLGLHAIKAEATVLDMQLGAAGNREFFSTGLNRTTAEVLLGELLTHKFSSSTSLQQKLAFYPAVSGGGDYRFNFDASSVTVIKKWLSWQLTLSDRLLSNPVAGRKKNDVLLTTGLRITFAR